MASKRGASSGAGRGRGGGGGGRGRGRGRGKTMLNSGLPTVEEDDDDDMSLASMVRPHTGGGGGGGALNSGPSPTPSDELLGMGGMGGPGMMGDGLGLGMMGGDFGGAMMDDFSSFGSIGSLSGDPLGNMASAHDPFVDMSTIMPDVSLAHTDMAETLLPPPADLLPPAKPKNKGGRKPKTKTEATPPHQPLPTASSSRFTHAPLSLAPFSYPSANASPLFHRACATTGGSSSGSSTHLAALARSVGSMSSEELAALAREVATMGREARARAGRLDAELRKMGPEAESWLHAHAHTMPPGHDMDETVLQAELVGLLAAASEYEDNGQHPQMSGKRKRPEDLLGFDPTSPSKNAPKTTGTSSSSAVTNAIVKKKKGTAGAGPSGVGPTASKKGGGGSYDSEEEPEEDDDAYYDLDDVDSKPTKKKKGAALNEKEKQRQVVTFWADVDEHFSYPSASTVGVMKPRMDTDFYDAYHGPGSSASFGKQPHSNDPAFRMPPAGEHYRELAERLREEEKEKQATAKAASDLALGIAPPVLEEKDAKKAKKNAAAKKSTKKTLSSALLGMGLDDARSKKALLETDKLLGGDKTFHQASGQTLSMRLLSMLVEQPAGATKSGPWFPHPSGKDSAKKKPPSASSSTHRKKASEYSTEKRIEMELKYLGLLAGSTPEYSYTRELADRADDELAATLRSAQKELSATLEALNVTRHKVYPTASRLTEHTSKMGQLVEAEQLLQRTYAQRIQATTTGRKKTLSSLHTNYNLGMNDPAIERAIDSWHETLQHTGSRRALTGFVPDPVDLGGIPRWRLNEYAPVRSYAEVYDNGVDVPLSVDEQGRPNFQHVIHPQHPHNADYQHPPPPPPPVLPEPQFVPKPAGVAGSRKSNNSGGAGYMPPAVTHTPSHPPAATSAPPSKHAPPPSSSGGGQHYTNSPHHPPPPSSSHGSSHGGGSQHGGSSHGHYQQSASGSHAGPPGGNYSYSNAPPPPSSSSHHRGGVTGAPSSSRNSSQAPLPPAVLPPSFPHQYPSGIGPLPPSNLGMAPQYDILGMDFMQSPTGLATPGSRRNMGLGASLSIGALPPSDTGIGQFAPSQDFFGMDFN